MAAADNPFYIQPPNVYQALMSGVAGYDKSQAAATENEKKQARIDAANALQSGADPKMVLGKLLQFDPATAAIYGNYASHQADIAERGRHNVVEEGLAAAGQKQTSLQQGRTYDLDVKKFDQSGQHEHLVPADPFNNIPGEIITTFNDGRPPRRTPLAEQPSNSAPQTSQQWGNAAPMNLTGPNVRDTIVSYSPTQTGPLPSPSGAPQAAATTQTASQSPDKVAAQSPDKIAAVMQQYGGTPGDGKNWAYLASLPEKAQLAVIGLTRHDVNPQVAYPARIAPGATSSLRDQAVTGAQKFDSTYNMQDYGQINRARIEFGPAGQSGRVVRALGVVSDHAGTLLTLGEALKNGNFTLANDIYNKIAKLTGGAAPTNFEMASKILGTEIVKSLGVAGAGGEAERAGYAIASGGSPEQISGVINTAIRPLIGGQMRGYLRSYVNDARRTPADFNKLIGPEAARFLGSDNAGGGGAQGAGGAARVVVQGGQRFQINPDGTSQHLGPAQ